MGKRLDAVFRRRPRELVGIDIGTHSIKLVLLRQEKDGWHLVHASSVPFPPGVIVDGQIMDRELLTAHLQGLVRDAKVAGAKCAISVSGHATIIKKITLPYMTLSELQDSIGWEAETYIPFDIKEVYLDVQIVSGNEASGQMDVLLTVVKKDLVNDLVQVATAAGLKVVIADLAQLSAINDLIFNGYTAPGELIAYVDVGANLTSLGVLNGNMLAFSRDISTGSGTLTAALRQNLNVRYEEAEHLKLLASRGEQVRPEVVEFSARVADVIATEVMRSLDFFTATSINSDIKRVVVMGGGSAMPGLVEALERRIELPVKVVNSFGNVLLTASQMFHLAAEIPSYAVAVGLALRHEGDSAIDFSVQPGYRVNLMPQVPKKPKRSFLPKVLRNDVQLHIWASPIAFALYLLFILIAIANLGADIIGWLGPKPPAPVCESVCPNFTPLSTDTPKKPETLDLDR